MANERESEGSLLLSPLQTAANWGLWRKGGLSLNIPHQTNENLTISHRNIYPSPDDGRWQMVVAAEKKANDGNKKLTKEGGGGYSQHPPPPSPHHIQISPYMQFFAYGGCSALYVSLSFFFQGITVALR